MLAVPLCAAIDSLKMTGITNVCRTVFRTNACSLAVITSCKPQSRDVAVVTMTSSNAEPAANAWLPALA